MITSFLAFLIRIIILENLNPPPVDPAQAPIQVRRNISVLENCGHTLKSKVAKPVVVIIEATVNIE